MKLGVILLLLIGLCSVSASADNSSSEKRPQQEISLPKTSNQTPKADQEITIKSPIIVNLQNATKTQEESKQIAEDRQEKITFDSSYLRATNWLVGIGVLTVIAYAIQCGLLICTLRHARKSSEGQLRSYVSFEIKPFRVMPDGRAVFPFFCINHGPTPAKDIGFRAIMKIIEWNAPTGIDLPPITGKWNEKRMDMFPNIALEEARKRETPCDTKTVLSPEQVSQFESGKIGLLIGMEIQYWDVFKTRHMTREYAVYHIAGTDAKLTIIPGGSFIS